MRMYFLSSHLSPLTNWLTSASPPVLCGIQIELVADFAGIKLDRVPRVVDIEHEV
jgi:hypothetical protein